MALFDEEPKKIRRAHEIGQDLVTLSVADLEERIAQMRQEITRLEAEIEAKSVTRSAADALFKR